MGRTLKTINAHLQDELDAWAPTRRAMRTKEEKARFDMIFTRIRLRTAEVSCAARPIPTDMLAFAWMLDVEEMLERIERRLDAIEAKLGIEERADPWRGTADMFEGARGGG